MPPPTIPTVSVNIQSHSGSVVYRSLVINQVVNGHHQFSFIWNIGELSHDSGSQLDVIRTNIGSMVTITIDDYNFKGIITQISVHEQTDHSQSFTVKGQSLTILLDDVPHSATYYKKDLKKIVKKTLDGIPANVMESDVNPKSSAEHHYVTQYNETDFQFLQRLATRYGEWFYYDGTTLKFGQTGDSGANLRSGSNLTSYSVKANLVPSRYSYMSYDYNTGDPVNKELPSFSSSVHNDFSSAAADKSGEVYTRTTDRPMHNFNLLNKNMMDSVAELEMQRLAAQLLFAKGESKHHALRPGYKFVVETANGNYDYVATHVTHMSNQSGHYENTFQGVPFSVEVPPYTNPHTFRQASPQSAIVKENHDADGLNRIKVHFAWQRSADNTPWIRVATPHAGSEKGWHFIPEKEEEVIVDFDGGDVDKPYVMSSHFHGKAKSKISNSGNNIKSLITKSGNTLTFNDSEGSITITDPKGSTIILKGDETIEIRTKKKILVESKDIEFNAENDITLSAKNNINLKATKDILAEAQGALTGKAMKAVTIKSSSDKVTIEGLQDVGVTSGTGAVKIEAMTEFKAKGTMGATVEGLKLDLKGTAMASLQAALVKIN